MRHPPSLAFGIPIDDLTMAETLGLIGELVAAGRATGRTHQIATVNVDFLVNSLDDPELRGILRYADVCLADGMPIVWASRLLGMPLRERVAGADLVPMLIRESQTRGWHVHVFGSAAHVADAARALLRERTPTARFSIDPGPMIADVESVDERVLDTIAEVDADILCVALGNPKQERFIRAHRERLGTPVLIGVGGSLDLLVGHRRRAPAWMQRIGLEWAARAVQEPRRLGPRYARDLRVFAPALARELRSKRRRRHGVGLRLSTSDTVSAELTGNNIPSRATWSAAAERLRSGAMLDLVDRVEHRAAAEPCDEALAQLVGLIREARRAGSRIRGAPRPVRLAPYLGHDDGGGHHTTSR